MLKFNSMGLLEPGAAILSDIDEFKSYFVKGIPNQHREAIFNNYVAYSHQLKSVCGNVQVKQWINGSYTTKKPFPNDIDIVTFIPFENVNANIDLFEDLKFPDSLKNYQVDAYIVRSYPETHPLYFLFMADSAYWLHQFTKTKRNRLGKRYTKGFLEINL